MKRGNNMTTLTNDLEERIKHVAIYLRKSRAEEGEKDLINHENRLLEIAREKGWSYEIYKEIGSGSSLDNRPEALRLINDIRKEEFDAVLVMDIDRLSRSIGDQERIFRELQMSDMLLVTGASYSILDPFSDSDTDMYHFKSFFSQQEAKIIKRRFREAKRAHRERGHWVSGRAPYGYRFNKKTRRLVVEPEEAEIVKRIFAEFTYEKKMPSEIAWGLNKDGLLSPTGLLWTNKMINRLINRDVYLGQTTYNKTQGTKKTSKNYSIHSVPYKRLPKSEWRTIHNTHEALMTPEQKEIIDNYLENWKRKRVRVNTNGQAFDLSGLCVTSGGLKYSRAFNKDKTENLVVSFDSRVPKSEYPKHIRVNPDLVRESILQAVKAIEKEIADNLNKSDNQEQMKSITKKIAKVENKHQTVMDSFDRLVEGFAEGLYDMETLRKTKEKKEAEQLELEAELRSLRRKLDTVSNSKNIGRLERVRKFQEDIVKATSNQEINLIYKSIIKNIICDRISPVETRIKINFL